MAIFLFHRMLKACIAGDSEAWSFLVDSYGPFVLALLKHYFKNQAWNEAHLMADIFGALAADNAALLRGFKGTHEREFLFYLRRIIFQRMGAGARAARLPAVPADSIAAVFARMPLFHQEVFDLKLKGYEDQIIDQMLKISPRTAAASVERGRGEMARLLGLETSRIFDIEVWFAIAPKLEGLEKEECASLTTLRNIIDGHIAWKDKEPVEAHIAACLYCLDRFASIKELEYHYHNAPPPASASIRSALAAACPNAVEGARKRTGGPLSILKEFLRRVG